MRKNKYENSRGIFSLLIRRNFTRLIWGLFVLVLLLVIFAGSFMPMANMPYFTLWMQSGKLASEDFDNISNFGITDGKGSFEIIDRNLAVVWPEDSDKSYPKDVIDNIWEVGYLRTKAVKNQYIKNGMQYTQIICSGTENYDGWFLLVDDSRNYVDSVNFPFIKDKYTKSDLEYVLKEIIFDVKTYKYEFVSNNGNPFTMIINYDVPAVVLDDSEINILIYVACGLVLLFILFIILSINSVSRKFKRPIKKLDSAMLGFLNGDHSDIKQDHGGVREIENVINTFNNMVTQLRESEAENLQLSQEKQRLIADISHDLKTPVTIIQGYTDALCQGKIPKEEQADYLEKIQIKTEHLNQLINEFSYYSKIDYPAFNLELKSIDICGFVRDYMAENYSYITDSGFGLEIDIPTDEYVCSIDVTHFKRCLLNILANFIKHNPAGTKIHAAVFDAVDKYTVILENNGTPVDAQIAQRLFEPFIMGDKSRKTGGGSGLGLAVVKKIINMHGGSIEYISKTSYVNCFRMTLPK